MREKPSREKNSRETPFVEEENKLNKLNTKIESLAKESKKDEFKKEYKMNDKINEIVSKQVKDQDEINSKLKIILSDQVKKHSELIDDEKNKHTYISNIDDKSISKNSTWSSLRVTKEIENIEQHEHENLDILNRLDPSYFMTSVKQIEDIISAVNKLIHICHNHNNIDVLDDFGVIDDKLIFKGKEVCLKDIDPLPKEPKKSFFRRILSKKGD